MNKATLRGSAIATVDANGRPRCKCGSTIQHADLHYDHSDLAAISISCKSCKRPIYSARLTDEHCYAIATAVVRKVEAQT